MNMLRKCLVIALFLLCVLALFSCASADVYGDFEYEAMNDGVYITRYLGDEVHIVIPESIDGIPVVSICLSSPDGYWTEPKAQSVVIPASVTRIEDICFRSFKQLTSISSLENITYVGYSAFQSCKIEEFVFSSKLSYIGSYAFDEHFTSVSVTIPDNYLHSNLNLIGHTIAEIHLIETGETPKYKVVDNVLFTADMKTLVLYPMNSNRTFYSIPDGVETIENAAFEKSILDPDLLEVYVPESVRTIYPRSFGEVTGIHAANFRPGLLVHDGSAAYHFASAAGIPYRVMEYGAQTLAERAAQIIRENTDASMSDYEKALALHDWLILNCEYDNTLTVYSAYGALFQGTGVCEAYSNAYRMLLTEVGIPNTIIKANNHQWNLAYIDNAWYHIDCTHDDYGDTASHQLFCLPDDLIRLIHNVGSEYAIHAVSGETNSLRYNYRYRNGEYDELIAPYFARVSEILNSGETSFYIPFTNQDATDAHRRSVVLIALNESDIAALPPGKTLILSLADDCRGFYGYVVDDNEYAQTDFTFDVINGSIRITGYTGDDSVVVIPDTLCGMAVTEIGKEAFFNTYVARHITVGSNVTRLLEGAFMSCWNMESITLPSGLMSIGRDAFSSCIRLKHIYLPDGLTELPSNLFSGCYELEDVVIPATVTTIGSAVFSGCRKITSVALPPDMALIPDSTFVGCASLTSVMFGDNITEIGPYAFFSCTSLTSLELPDTIKVFGAYSFSFCSGLTFDKLPASLESIGQVAMSQMDAVTTLHFPDNLRTIEASAFEGSTNIAYITVSEKNEHFAAINGILYTKDGKTLVYCPPGIQEKYVVVPFGVEQIQASAFYKCKNIEKIGLPETVSVLGREAFAMCDSLSEINIPNGVTSLPDECLSGANIRQLHIPESVTTLGMSALISTKLESLVLPDSVTTLGWMALSGLHLSSFTIPQEITSFTNYEMHETSIGVLTIHENFIGFGPCLITIGEIKGYAGTFAERYALENEIPFTDLMDLRIDDFLPSAERAYTGDCVQWTARASGSYGELNYTFMLYENGSLIDQLETREGNYSHYAANTGRLVLTVTATDSAGQTATAVSAAVNVEEAALEIVSVALPDDAQTDRELTIAVSARGGKGQKLYSASVYLDGVLVAFAEPQYGNEITITVNKAGRYDAIVEVRDDAGNLEYWRSESFMVAQLPLAIVTIEPNTAQAVVGTILSWNVRVEGGAQDNVYAYSVFVDETLLWESGAMEVPTVTWLAERDGVYTVRCHVADSDGNTFNMTGGHVTVTEHAPLRFVYARLEINETAENISPIPSWSQLVARAEGGVGTITYSYYAYLDLVPYLVFENVNENSSRLLSVTAPHTLTARIDARDEAGNHISVSFGPVQIVNPTQLSVASIVANRFNPQPGDDIGWSVSSRGGYGEKTYRYELFKDDVLLISSDWTTETGFTYPSASEGTYILRVTVKDERNSQVSRRGFVTTVQKVIESTLYLPASIEVICEEAFVGVAAKKVVISTGCESICARAFADSQVELVVVPASVIFIADDAFIDCKNLSLAVSSAEDYAAQWADEYGIHWYILR